MRILPALITLILFAASAQTEKSHLSGADLVKNIVAKYNITQYVFEGNLTVTRRTGDVPRTVLVDAKVKYASAPAGKFSLSVNEGTKSGYVIMSDGQKLWTYVPDQRRYTEQDVASLGTTDPSDTTDPQSLPDYDIIERVCRTVVPVLAKLDQTADNVHVAGGPPVRYEGQVYYSWRMLTVLSKKDPAGLQDLSYITFDPATLRIARLDWTKAIPSKDANEGKILVRSAFDFTTFRPGETAPSSEFVFSAPKNAKRVKTLRLPSSPRHS